MTIINPVGHGQVLRHRGAFTAILPTLSQVHSKNASLRNSQVYEKFKY